MNTSESPRLLARIGGVFYLFIIVFALFAYRYHGRVIVPGDMAQTASRILAHEGLYRLGFSAAVIAVICNLPMGLALFELLKIVNRRVALLAFAFLLVAETIEAVNLFNYIQPLLIFSLPSYANGVQLSELQLQASGPLRLFSYGFSVSLAFFGVFCALTGFLILRSRFLPRIFGVLMIVAGLTYVTDNFSLFLALKIPYIPWLTLVAESSLALWLTVVGVNQEEWRAQAAESAGA